MTQSLKMVLSWRAVVGMCVSLWHTEVSLQELELKFAFVILNSTGTLFKSSYLEVMYGVIIMSDRNGMIY